MNQLTNEKRKAKERPFEPQDAFNRWVEEMAEVKGLTITEVLDLAIVKQENLTYTGGEQ